MRDRFESPAGRTKEEDVLEHVFVVSAGVQELQAINPFCSPRRFNPGARAVFVVV